MRGSMDHDDRVQCRHLAEIVRPNGSVKRVSTSTKAGAIPKNLYLDENSIPTTPLRPTVPKKNRGENQTKNNIL
jgi:hypothetical protein